jgi:hypothetical protein
LAVAAAIAAVTGVGALATGVRVVGVGLLAATVWLSVASRSASRLAARARVGADAEDVVRRALDQLARDGWAVEHGVAWPGGGDIDHLVRSPQGVGFAIETKTRSFNQGQLDRTLNTARWAAGRRRRYPRGVVPVLCVVRSRGLAHRYDSVLVVSVDRIVPALRNTAAQAEPTAAISVRRADPRESG